MPAPGTLGEIPAVGVVPVAFAIRISTRPHAELLGLWVAESVGNAGAELHKENGFPSGYHLESLWRFLASDVFIPQPQKGATAKVDLRHLLAKLCQPPCKLFGAIRLPALVFFQFCLQLIDTRNRQRNNNLLAHDTLTFVAAMDTEFKDLATLLTM